MSEKIDKAALEAEFKKRDLNGDGVLDVKEIEEIFTDLCKQYYGFINEKFIKFHTERSSSSSSSSRSCSCEATSMV